MVVTVVMILDVDMEEEDEVCVVVVYCMARLSCISVDKAEEDDGDALLATDEVPPLGVTLPDDDRGVPLPD